MFGIGRVRSVADQLMLRSFWRCGHGHAGIFLGVGIVAIRSRLEPVKRVARMLKKRLGYALNYLKYRLPN
jgi:hypothetical protein